MSVYLVTRSHYVGAAGKKIQKFEDETVLAWFQKRWTDEALEESDLAYFFEDIVENEVPPPESDAELAELLEEHLYAEGGILFAPHCIQILHDDDELEFAFYLFDDHFLAANPNKTVFLLQEDWELPTDAGNHSVSAEAETTLIEPSGKGEGITYLVYLAYYDSSNLIDLDGHYRIEGVRLPELASYLRSVPDSPDREEWPFELHALRELALLQESATLEELLKRAGHMSFDSVSNQFYETAFSKEDLPEALRGLRTVITQLNQAGTASSESLSVVQPGEHLAQLALHTATWDEGKLFHRWILFDDLWIGKNQVLSEAILRYASRWDVLS